MICLQCGKSRDGECRCVAANDLMGFLQDFHAAKRNPVKIGTPETIEEVVVAPMEEVAENAGDGPEAGWYPDPTGEYPLRWWNGVAWTAMASVDGLEVCESVHALTG